MRAQSDNQSAWLTILTEDLDNLLLLTIQSACNLTGVKIPWDKVAELMGPKFTEGAIVQHLSKLRLRRENNDLRVPPPLRRSVAVVSSMTGDKKGSKKGQNKRKSFVCHATDELSDEFQGLDDDEDEEDDDEEDDEDEYEDDEEDEEELEYSRGPKRIKSNRQSFLNVTDSRESRLRSTGKRILLRGASFLPKREAEKHQHNYGYDNEYHDCEAENEDIGGYDLAHMKKVMAQQATPTRHPVRIVKLPLGGALDLKQSSTPFNSASNEAEVSATPFNPNDPAIINPAPGGPPSEYTPPSWLQQAMANRVPENPFSPVLTRPAPVVGNRMFSQGEYLWSPHAPIYASGRAGAPTGPVIASEGLEPAPETDMESSTWNVDDFINFEYSHGDENRDATMK